MAQVTGASVGARHTIAGDALRAAADAHLRFLDYGVERVVAAAEAMAASLKAGGKVLAFGNGGSAADAQHVIAELVGRFSRDRAAMAGVALSTDTSVITSLANDFGYETIFARQIEALGRPGDIALGISTSGNSESVVRALTEAKARDMITIALTGRDGGAAGKAAGIHVNVREQSVARIQEVHQTILHAMCEIVERIVCPAPEV